jgi:hypothetical protein
MKTIKLTLLLILLFFSSLTYSQKKQAIKINYNWDFIGDNLEIGWQKKVNEHIFSIGLMYFLNVHYENSVHYAFKKRYYATNFKERLGLPIEYNYLFKLRNSDIEPYCFYSLHIFNNRINAQNGLVPAGTYENKELYYKSKGFISDPLFSFQNSIGLGTRFQLFKNFELYAETGAGITFLPLEDTHIVVRHQREFSVNFTIGAIYN